MSSVPQFDELYVISDLHLGGDAGFQIFNAGSEADWLIKHLLAGPEKKIALLINGDLVDFLAERPARHFDPVGAIEKLDRIVNDPSFALVWAALREFAGTKNRCLIINLGNHDLELALPWVRAHLLKILADGNEAAYGRIVLTFDGSGFRCRVGSAEILCVHGNEVDDWNVTDHEKIRRLGRDLVQGQPVESWIPNAGTQLVIDVMNDLKSRHPFVDLLKPELEAVVPTLLALAPDQRDKVRGIAGTARRLAWDKLRRATGLLGVEADGPESGEPATLWSGSSPETARKKYAEELLREAEERMRRGVDPMSLIQSDEQGRSLGGLGAVRRFVRGESRAEVLREALEGLGKSRDFDLTFEDDTFQRLDEKMGKADFLVAGHTHLERALPRRKGSGWYFNSGTWVRLIRIERDVLKDPASFQQIFNAFQDGTMKALDDLSDLVLRRPTVVAFWTKGGSTHGELWRVSLKETKLIPVKDSRFTRS